jgi:glycosyltransferase involved in cell wall biosynthesis
MVSIDVITVSYNSIEYLQRCFDSVRKNRSSINKYIVIDGGSSDGTVELIERNLDIISDYVSEPDDGISDAFNKGVVRCEAEFILIVNSDDWILDTNLADIRSQIESNDEIVFTPMVSFLANVCQGVFTSNPDYISKFNSVLHPGCLVSTHVYKHIGLYDKALYIAMDYDFFSRCFKADIKYRHIDLPLVAFQEGGTSRQRRYRILMESFKIRKRYFGVIFPIREIGRYMSRVAGDFFDLLGLKVFVKRIIRRYLKL